MKKRVFEQVIHIILTSLFPPRCYGCGAYGPKACDDCLKKTRATSNGCFFCSRTQALLGICRTCAEVYPIDGILWAFTYRAPLIRKLIHDLKYKKRQECAQLLAPYLAAAIADMHFPPSATTIAVPLHPAKERERGFNQAEIIAVHLGRVVGKNILARDKETPPLARSISRKNRFLQIQNAFALVQDADVAGKSFLLIDDVATTGATVIEAARVLKANGAKKVYAAVLAHG